MVAVGEEPVHAAAACGRPKIEMPSRNLQHAEQDGDHRRSQGEVEQLTPHLIGGYQGCQEHGHGRDQGKEMLPGPVGSYREG